jgi:hypothetical protein
MKVTINPTLDMETLQWVSNDGVYEYDGPVMKFDRWATGQAKSQVGTDTATAGGYGNQAGQIAGIINPALKNAVNNPTGYTAQQQHEQLTAGEAGAGGATAGLSGAAGLAANRTHNSGALTGINDALARAKAGAGAKVSEGIAAKSADLGEANKQRAISGLQGERAGDIGAQLHSQGQATDALNAEVNAGKSGWFQNMTDFMKAAGQDAAGAGAMMAA